MFDKPDGTVKFIDFGLACQFKSKNKEIVGSPYFIAPEVFKQKFGFECDIWSLGVVIYMMLTGKMPFNGISTNDLFRNIVKANFTMPKNFSKDLKDLITKMLIKEPKQRITAKNAMDHPWFSSTRQQEDQITD